MSFADTWAAQISEAARNLAEKTANPDKQDAIDRFELYGIAAAYDIASSPHPGVNLLDIMVLASLNRMVWEDYWGPQVFQSASEPMITVLQSLEAEIWRFAQNFMTPSQLKEIRQVIQEWRANNPNKRGVHFIRFSDFGDLGRKPTLEKALRPGGLLGPVKEAAAAAEEIRVMGDRALFMIVRMQEIMALRLETSIKKLLRTPELSQALGDFSQIRNSSERYADLLETMPEELTSHTDKLIRETFEEIAEERQAAIEQILQGIAEERRSTLEQFVIDVENIRKNTINHIIKAISQERHALVRDSERILRKGSIGLEMVTTHIFVLTAALLLLYFLLRMIFRFGTNRSINAWYGRLTAVLMLLLSAFLVIISALAYIYYIAPIITDSKVSSITDEGDIYISQGSATNGIETSKKKLAKNNTTITESIPAASDPAPDNPFYQAQNNSEISGIVNSSNAMESPEQVSLKNSFRNNYVKKDVSQSNYHAIQEIVSQLRILFQSNSTEIASKYHASLDYICGYLIENQNIQINIQGHTDSHGTLNINRQISEKRAESVARYLIQCGVNQNKILITSYGSSRPVSSNDTVEGRAKNRRVELKIVR